MDYAFVYFEKLSGTIAEHGFCKYKRWQGLGYRCVPYKKKYIVAFLSLSNEVVICDFVSTKGLREYLTFG